MEKNLELVYAELVTRGYTDDLLAEWIEAHTAPMIRMALKAQREKIVAEVRALLGSRPTYGRMDELACEARGMEKVVQYVADQIEKG